MDKENAIPEPPDNSGSDNDEDPPLDWRTWSILISVGVLTFNACLESTILAPVLPSISKGLNGSTSSTLWTGSSFLLTATVFSPPIARLAEEFGHRTMLLISICLFCIGVLICCLSDTMTVLIVGRSIQGIGAGGIRVVASMVPSAMVSVRQLPVAILPVQVGYVAGSIIGPVVGGYIGEYTTWRWIFYLNFPACGFVLLVVLFMMEDKSENQRSLVDRLRRLDYAGAFLFLASISSLLIGIMWGGEQFPWGSWHTIVPIVCGVFGLGLALIWEGFGTSSPFIDLSTFRLLAARSIYAGAFLSGFIFYCQLYYLPIYFEGVRGWSPGRTGLAYLPMTFGMLIGSVGSLPLLRKTPRLRWIIISGWILITVPSALFFLFDEHFATFKWVLIFLVLGAGHELLLTTLFYAIQVIATGPQAGQAVSMYIFLRSLGPCIGVAITSTLLQNSMQSHGSQSGAGSTLMELTDLAAHPDLPPALLDSFHYMAALVTGASALGLVFSLFSTSTGAKATGNEIDG